MSGFPILGGIHALTAIRAARIIVLSSLEGNAPRGSRKRYAGRSSTPVTGLSERSLRAIQLFSVFYPFSPIANDGVLVRLSVSRTIDAPASDR